MRRVTLVAMIVIGMCGSALVAQDIVPIVGHGSRALLFSFSGLANLGAGTFDGGIGGRYYLSEALSVRGGLQLASASQTTPANAPSGQQGIDGSTSASSFGLSGAAEWHMGKSRVIPFVGAGLMYSHTTTESKTVETGNPPPDQTTRKNRGTGENVNGVTYVSGTLFQIFGLAGVEFFLTKELSLSAEYQLGYGSVTRPDQEVSSGSTTTTTKMGSGTGLGISTAGSLTLAVYIN